MLQTLIWWKTSSTLSTRRIYWNLLMLLMLGHFSNRLFKMPSISVSLFTSLAKIYMTAVAFNLRKKKNKLWKEFASTGSLSDLSDFKKVNNEFRKLTCDLRKDYEKCLVNNIGNKPFGSTYIPELLLLMNCTALIAQLHLVTLKWQNFLIIISLASLPTRKCHLFLLCS